MGIVVQKFGGSSVADKDKLFNVCQHIIKEYNSNNNVVVVVSAQGKTTDKLVEEEEELTSIPDKREHDVLVSVGEQITIAKLTMCLKKLGYDAISFTGWQVPIITDDMHCNANIIDIHTEKILNHLGKNKIVIVAGFQGINSQGDITTLGRGGSDTTAVALAAYLKADKLYIYTDVDGVYSEDPNINPNAIKYKTITYEKMLKIANNRSKGFTYKMYKNGKKF